MENLDEIEKKIKYYKSNPLRNYAPTKGQLILPERHEPQPLPKIYTELRKSKNYEEDRQVHRQKLKSHLKLKLNELGKNPLDQLENSKKVYNEFCKLNITKPIDLSNVKSILKENLKITPRKFNDDPIEYNSKIKNLSKSADLLIDAHNIDFKQIDELNEAIKNHKQKLAKLEFKPFRRTSPKKPNSSSDHRGSIYNYRRAVREYKSMVKFGSVDSKPSSSHELLRVESQLDNKDGISKDHSIIKEYEYLNTVLSSSNITNEEKHKLRVKQARDKILNEQIERQNLNRMTILQPFEDTKILINIDQVPSGFLNHLLNKENNAPRYYIPPVRPLGYYKKVINEVESRANSRKDQRNYFNRSIFNEFQAEQHNFTLESLKTLNESSNHFLKDQSINNFNSNSNVNFDLRVNIIKKDVSVK